MFGMGERLENIRRVRMWTQARLAREAGVSPTTVSGIETGKIARPHFGTLGKLARALGVAPEELLDSHEPSSSKVRRLCRWGGREKPGQESSRAGLRRTLPSIASTPYRANWTPGRGASRDVLGVPRGQRADAVRKV
jgi:transcriptional regulator with XRE-family HTH domain